MTYVVFIKKLIKKKRNLNMEISLSKVIVFFELQAFFNHFYYFFVTWFFEESKHVLFVCLHSGLIEWNNTESVKSILHGLKF